MGSAAVVPWRWLERPVSVVGNVCLNIHFGGAKQSYLPLGLEPPLQGQAKFARRHDRPSLWSIVSFPSKPAHLTPFPDMGTEVMHKLWQGHFGRLNFAAGSTI